MGDRQHIDRNRTQVPAADLGGKPEQRRVVAQLLPVFGAPALSQALGRAKGVRIVVEAGHQR